MHNGVQAMLGHQEGNPGQAPHFLVSGLLLSPWRLFGNKPAHIHVQWPPVSPSQSDAPTPTTPMPLLLVPHWAAGSGKAQWLPILLQRAWCVGPWQCLFFTTPWRPRWLGVFVCTQYHPMLRLYLRHLEHEAKQPGNWGLGHVY